MDENHKTTASPLSAVAVGVAITPVPHHPLKTSTITIKSGTILHRIHNQKYDADQFNPGTRGNARFSPIQNNKGEPIPTLYGGATKDCALMETIFHDVPWSPGLKTLDKNKFEGQVHSKVELTQDLELVDLSSIALRQLGITRKQLIDTEKDQYPLTHLWTKELHHCCHNAQGLSWISRQDDSARAVVLFGDRISTKTLRPVGHSVSLINDTTTYNEVLNLAERLGVFVIPGK